MENSSNLLSFAAGLLALVVIIAITVGVTTYLEFKEFGKAGTKEMSMVSKQLHFAAVALTGLAVLYALGMAMYYWNPSPSGPGKDIFDAVKTTIPPIVTLILGYYFGSKHADKPSS